MAMNKISGLRYREELERGHHILSNGELDGKGIQYKKSMYNEKNRPYEAWNHTIQPPPAA